MKCPDCGEEMEKGILQASQIMLWAKKKHRVSLLPKEGEVLLAKNYLSGITIEDAYICKRCKKVVFDYAATEVRQPEI